jgi:hypothetical protein
MQFEQLDGVRVHANLASSDASRDRARRSLPTNRMSFFRHHSVRFRRDLGGDFGEIGDSSPPCCSVA